MLHRKYLRRAYALLFVSVVFAFGNGTHIGYAANDRKPWYFLSALYVSTVANLGAMAYLDALLARRRSRAERQSRVESAN